MVRAFALLLATLTAGCSATWEPADRSMRPTTNANLGLFDGENMWDDFPAPDGPIAEGQWRALPPDRPVSVGYQPEPRTAEPAAPVETRPAPVFREPPPLQPTLPIPEKRTKQRRKSKAEQAQPRDLDLLAREHFVRNPTHIRADRITLICPRAYRREVRLRGDVVEDGIGKARDATGGASLVLRELLLEAEQIIVRTAKDDTIQILARGGVAFVSRVKDRVVREEGLRSLILTNDRSLPLR